jgi:hypothetical protein
MKVADAVGFLATDKAAEQIAGYIGLAVFLALVAGLALGFIAGQIFSRREIK